MNNQELLKTYFSVNNNELLIVVSKSDNQEVIFSKKKILSKKQNKLISEEIELFFTEKIDEIEKKINSFVKNISLILRSENIFSISFSFKKKFNDKASTKDEIKKLLIDGLRLIYKHHPDIFIIHYLIDKIDIDGQTTFSTKGIIINEYICIDLKFICINKDLIEKFKKLLKKKEIFLEKVFSEDYIRQYNDENNDIIKTVFEIDKGLNSLEIKLIPKMYEKKGFFENFFLSF